MMQHGKKKKKTSYNTILLLAIPVIILLVLSWPLVLRVHDAMTSKDASAPRAAKPVSRLGSFKGKVSFDEEL